MITCCWGCTARRLHCHDNGQCVHYMHQKAVQAQINEQRRSEIAGAYYANDSRRVNLKRREQIRKGRDL